MLRPMSYLDARSMAAKKGKKAKLDHSGLVCCACP